MAHEKESELLQALEKFLEAERKWREVIARHQIIQAAISQLTEGTS